MQPGIMSGRQKLGPDAVRIVKQLAEFDLVVAHHAWIGRAANRVFVDKVIDDVAKFFFEVECVKRNTQSFGHAASILRVGGAAAALFVVGPIVKNGQQRRGVQFAVNCTGSDSLFAMSHENTDYFMTLFGQKMCRDARIDAARHC